MSTGVGAGALVLTAAIWLPRPMQVALAAIALLSSLLVMLLVPDLVLARAPLTLFNWSYGHLLNFNGLTRSILLVWPIAASLWLFALGRGTRAGVRGTVARYNGAPPVQPGRRTRR